MWLQKQLLLKAKPRGFHLITDEVLRQLPELATINVGMLNIFIAIFSFALAFAFLSSPTGLSDSMTGAEKLFISGYANSVTPNLWNAA